MKVEFMEYEGGYDVTLTAETLPEAAFLSRMAMNGRERTVTFYTLVDQDGCFTTRIDAKKAKNYTSSIRGAR